MSKSIPLDIIFAVIEQLVFSTHPLAYEYTSSVHTTLQSFLLVCKDTSGFVSRHLYSRVCVKTTRQLHQLCAASLPNVRLINAMHICLDHADKEIVQSLSENGIEGYDDMFLSHVKESYGDLGKSLSYLLQAAQPSLKRLAIAVPAAYAMYLGLSFEEVEMTLEGFRKELGSALANLRPNLTELSLLGRSPFRDYFSIGEDLEWSNLRRLCVCSRLDGCLAYPWPSMPALEGMCFPHWEEAIDLSFPRIKRAVIFTWDVESDVLDFWDRLDSLSDVVLVTADDCRQVYDKVPAIVRSGLLWDVEHWRRAFHVL